MKHISTGCLSRSFLSVILLTTFILTGINAQTSGRAITGLATQTLRANQSKVFWHDGYWWGLFVKSQAGANRYIYKLENGDWLAAFKYDDTSPEESYTDIYIDSQQDFLYIVDAAQARFWRLDYHGGTQSWSAGIGPVPVTITTNQNHAGCITRGSNGRLFIFTTNDANSLQGQFSDDEGASWTFFDIRSNLNSRGMTDAVAFRYQNEDYIGLAIGENSNSPEFHFFRVREDDDPTIPGNWTEETLDYGHPVFVGDNHVSIIKDFEQNLYLIGKYGTSSPPGVAFALFRRDHTHGRWATYDVQAPAGTRPALSFDETNDKLYLFATVSGKIQCTILDAHNLRNVQSSDWMPVLQNGADAFNDLSVSYQPLTAASDMMVIAANYTAGNVWYNALPLNSDANDPLIISEVNSTANIAASYVELHNTTATALDLSVYSLRYYDDNSPTPATLALNGSIPAYGYKVIARNAAAYFSEYQRTADFENTGFSLDGGKDGIALFKNTGGGVIVDYFNNAGGEMEAWSAGQLFHRTRLPNNGLNIYIDYDRSRLPISGSPGAPPLSMLLSSFSASVVDNRVNLKWATDTEVDNREWIIERRMNTEEDFTEIARLSGKGNTSQRTEYEFPDGAVIDGNAYEYRLSSVDFDGLTHRYPQVLRVNIAAGSIEDFRLYANYPNPFNAETRIRFRIGEPAATTLVIYDIRGREVKTLFSGNLNPGEHIHTWDATDNYGNSVASGLYLLRLRTTNFFKSIKMVLTR